MIDEVRVDSDEGGFVLELVGDFTDAVAAYLAGDDCRLVLRLPQDAAVALNAAVRAQVAPYVAEMEFHRRGYAQATEAERATVLRLVPDPDCGYDADDPKHPGYHDLHADAAG